MAFLGPYRCRFCPLTWSTERGKNVHETTGHRTTKDIEISSCTLCGKGYQNLSSLRRHLRKQHELLDNPMATSSEDSSVSVCLFFKNKIMLIHHL